MNILLIAYYFPPDSSSGAFRPLIFARYLKEMGEHVCILTADEKYYLPEQPRDNQLLGKPYDGLDIFRSKVFRPREAVLGFRDLLFRKTERSHNGSVLPSVQKDRVSGETTTSLFQQCKDAITDSLSTPDPHVGWLPSAVKKGLKVIKRKKIDILYATGGPWTGMLIGTILKKLTGKALVIDFRDPWVSNPFTVKGKFFQYLETLMERKVVAIADHIITNTEELRQDFLHRYPFLTEETITTIPNGFEEYLDSQGLHPQNDVFTLIHAGALYFSRNPRCLLQALINVIEKGGIPKEHIRLLLLGGISINDAELENILQHPALHGILEQTPRLPYQEAVECQKTGDVLLLIQPDFPLQIPRKLYEYIAFRRPLLAITESHGATARVVRENHLGVVVENEIANIESALQLLYTQWRENTLFQQDHKETDKFLNRNLTHELLKIFQVCLKKSS